MSFVNKIAGSFGAGDLKFAGHPLDAERAADLLKECIKSGETMKDVLDAVEAFLKGKGATSGHIREQLNKVEEKFGPWLN